MNFLKKVIAVKRLAISDVKTCDRIAQAKILLKTDKSYEDICIKVPADLEISSKIEKKVRMFTAKLSFRCTNDSFKDGRYIYVAQLSNGCSMLLGSDDKPFPVVETSQKFSSDEGSSQLIQVTVTYTSSQAIATVV